MDSVPAASPEISAAMCTHDAYGLMWLVLIVQNAIAQLVTGPPTEWKQMAFSIYYVLLFTITAVVVFHFHSMQARYANREST